MDFLILKQVAIGIAGVAALLLTLWLVQKALKTYASIMVWLNTLIIVVILGALIMLLVWLSGFLPKSFKEDSGGDKTKAGIVDPKKGVEQEREKPTPKPLELKAKENIPPPALSLDVNKDLKKSTPKKKEKKKKSPKARYLSSTLLSLKKVLLSINLFDAVVIIAIIFLIIRFFFKKLESRREFLERIRKKRKRKRKATGDRYQNAQNPLPVVTGMILYAVDGIIDVLPDGTITRALVRGDNVEAMGESNVPDPIRQANKPLSSGKKNNLKIFIIGCIVLSIVVTYFIYKILKRKKSLQAPKGKKSEELKKSSREDKNETPQLPNPTEKDKLQKSLKGDSPQEEKTKTPPKRRNKANKKPQKASNLPRVPSQNPSNKQAPKQNLTKEEKEEIEKITAKLDGKKRIRGRRESSILHKAVFFNQVEALGLLIRAGYDVNIKNSRGDTPLHWAAWLGYKECSEVLLSSGAHIDAQNDKGERPLHTACFYGLLGIVKTLIDHGADIHAKTKEQKRFWGWWVEEPESPLERAKKGMALALFDNNAPSWGWYEGCKEVKVYLENLEKEKTT